MRAWLALAAAMLVALTVASMRTAADAAPAATRLVDRTLVCKVGMANGARSITVSAQSAFLKGSGRRWLAQAAVVTPGNPVPAKRNEYLPTLVGFTAGWPPPAPLTSGGLGINLGLCALTRTVVRLSSKGLRGGEASVFGDEAKCVSGSRVVVRVRVAFAAPVTLVVDDKSRWQDASARIERAQLAVRSLSGKAVAYAEARDSGIARLFAAKNCF